MSEHPATSNLRTGETVWTGRGPRIPISWLAAAGRANPEVRVQVPAGWWRLTPASTLHDPNPGYIAELAVPVVGHDAPQVIYSTRTTTLSQLEAALGWPIPLPIRLLLTLASLSTRSAATGPRTSPGADRPALTADPADPAESAIYRPSRSNTVQAGDLLTTYGRLLAAETVIATWSYGTARVDLLSDPPPNGVDDDLAYWRIYDGERILFAGAHVPGLLDLTADPSEALRSLLGLPAGLRRASIRLAAGQAWFVDRYADLFDQFAAIPGQIYPPGTHVRVTLPDGQDADGALYASAPRDGGGTTYRWRPDAANQPGHPWQRHPTWTLETTELHLTDILGTHISTDDQPDVPLATGAVVRTVDDPRFTVGTVLRALHYRTGSPTYEVQPHDTPTRPLLLPADAVLPLRPSAWPSLDRLLTARADAGLDLLSGEVLATTTETARVFDGPHGPRLYDVRPTPPGPVDPTRAAEPATVSDEVPALLTLLSGPTPTATAQLIGTTRLVRDPVHGHLAVHEIEYQQALALGPDRLGALLARRPWLSPGNPPLETAAALAAIHAPLDVLTTFVRLSQPPPTSAPGSPGMEDVSRPAAPSPDSPSPATSLSDPAAPAWDGP
ncbi:MULTISPECIES: hypothetical protein [unclassified Pseudofrankia]|uniref:hypothetical protein n=1 Tax=unclassified Pseudofrankia TaxID=2994372 RepID=UPI0008D9B26B|nr:MULTISPECIES: hypothetical protein [unclassified Pseudofrankia]MDT3443613.1 hypothetical protein [Pseudofrankia sp. BMG5.37]OHV43930.1 hypothetical protein BCD48_26390 [Pseudofrankia sp. BMG5.36]